MKASLPPNEAQRLETLRGYSVLDTPPEQAFDDLTLLAAQICLVPIALVSLVDEHRQWFKSKIGLDATETTRDIAFCAHAILYADEVLEVRDARLDPRFADNPLVTADPHIRFYAGAPLVAPDGHALGTLCAIDRVPRELSAAQKQAMQALSRHVIALLELRRSIAEQKRVEAQLQKTLILQRAILDNAGHAIIASTPDCVIHTFNPAAERMLGYSAAEMAGATPALIHDLQEVEARAKQFSAELGVAVAPGCETFVARARRNLPNEYEWTYIRKDGTRFPVLLTVTALRDSTGEITGFLGLAVDISERKKTQLALEQFKFALDQTVDCIFMCRADDFRFIYVNEGAKRQVGYNEAELFGMTVLDIKPEFTLERYKQLVQPLLDGAQPSLNFETLHRHKDGHDIPVEITLQAVRQASQEPRLLAVVRDITERKRSEKLLRAKNEELKGFAYTVAHDLKAPLRGISGYAQELERRHKEGLAERARFCITQITTASKNLDALIEDLLRYSRLDTDIPTQTEVNLPDLIQCILRDRTNTLTEMKIEVSVNVPAIIVRTWERGLHQVLANLVDNAVKYSRRSQPPRLTISAETLGNACRITVADNGIGFDMKYHDRIFGLFNRLVRADEFEGTGAGLAIVKKLVEKLGGSIRAESAPGQGAAFFVELPISSAGESTS